MLSASVAFAADEDITLNGVDDEVSEEEVLSVEEDADALSVVDDTVIEADDGADVLKTTKTVTNDTFFNYFNEDGDLNSTEEELEFEGDFTGINVNYITIDKAIKLTGKNATFNGVSFVITANNVVLDGFKLYSDNKDTSLISIGEVTNVTISNNLLDYKALKDFNSYGIYAYNIDTLKLINNTINYVGNTNGSSINNAIYVEGDSNEKKASKNIIVEGNKFDITIPSIEVNYMTSPYTTYSEGIVFFFCEDVKFSKNTVNMKYNTFEIGKTSPDSFYALSVKSNENINDLDWDDDDNPIFTYPITSKNVEITANNFTVCGHNHTYAVALAADNFKISGNVFNVSSQGPYANAITLNNLAANGNVTDNNISVSAQDAVYGIVSYQMGHPIKDNVYRNNNIIADAYLACGMELSEINSIVDHNMITSTGNYTYGILMSLFGDSDKGIISDNTIVNLGSNIGDKGTNDPIAPKNSMAITVKSNADEANLIIKENNIFSTNIGINVAEDSEKVTLQNNTIVVTANNGKKDNYAIVAEDAYDLTIIGNNVTYSGLVDYQFTVVDSYEWGGYTYYIYDSSNNTRTYGVYIKDSEVVISGNDFNIMIPTFAVNWGAVREAFSEGIVLEGCDDLKFTDNNVVVTANGGTSWDTIYGIDILNSANPLVENNNITVNGAGYTYAIIINDEYFNITENNITVTSDNYACGIDVEGAANGAIKNNSIVINAATSAYPIYTGMTAGNDVIVDISGNEIEGRAYYAVGLEIAASKALIERNNVYVDGNHTIGVATKVADLIINDNAINAFASNEGNESVGDNMGPLNSAIKVVGGNATITNNAIASNAIGINVDPTAVKVNIEKNDITVNANSGKVDNYAIVADNITDLKVVNNNITYSGLVDYQFTVVDSYEWGGYTYYIYDSSNNTRTYGVYIKDSEVVISGNDFNIMIPTFAVNWGAVREAFSEGIVLEGCDDLKFTDNNVVVTANGGTSWDTIYGIDILNSANPLVENNNITVNGAGYTYAIIINDEYFNITENNITVTSDNYACGIDVEGVANGNISDNTISIVSTSSAYPIYSGMNQAPVTVDIKNNDISAESYYAIGIEVGGDKVLIEENNIDVKGNYTMGIASQVSELTVNNNTIVSVGSDQGNDPVYDTMGAVTTGIMVNKGNFTITNNDVETTGEYAAVLGDNNGSVINNQLSSNAGAGDNAIIGLGNVTVSGNPATKNKYLKVVLFANDFTKVYGSADQFIAKILDENGQPVGNKTIKLIIDGVTYTNTSDFDGNVAFDINLVAGEYSATVKFDGDADYGFKSIVSIITVTPKPTAFTAPAATFLVTATKSGVNYNIVLKDNSGNVLANKSVNITFNGKTSTVVTDAKGAIAYKVVATKAGSYNLALSFAGDDKYAASTATAAIKVNKEAVKITAKKKTFKAKVKTKKYTVTVKDSKGKAIKGLKVTLKVKGKKYTAKTNAKGKATFKIKNLKKKGTYTAKVNFAGNNLYNKAAKSVKITVKK